MVSKATAVAHPIQGLVKYHGMRDDEQRLPYHDSISVCTAPSRTTTTAVFESDRDENHYVIDGEVVTDTARLDRVVDAVRERADIDEEAAVRLESENTFPTNVGLGSSSSGFAAAATALAAAAGLDLSLPELSTIARRGSASAARAVTGGFSHLRAGLSDADCRSERIATDLGDDLTIVVGLVSAYKETDDAHAEAAASHMFDARRVYVEEQILACREALRQNDFETTFELAEHDSLSLAATTMTGPEGWVYWKPATLDIFEAVRDLRAEGVPAYFSVDTGATVYINTPDAYADRVEDAVAACGVETRQWHVGGPARVVDDHLF
ncbi:MAG: phosphomevalonate decarboxylase MvaD [Salinarchaeum sp.]